MSSVMKLFITGFHLQNAASLAEKSSRAHDMGDVQDEVRSSIGAYILAALSLEGAANEVCESILSNWAWQRTEKADTSLKWYLISKFASTVPFDPGLEPLSTVLLLQRVRNRLVHPKSVEVGVDVIVRYKDGSVEHNVADDRIIQEDVDAVYFGFGDLLKEFSGEKTRTAVKQAYGALCTLREVTGYKGLDWLDSLPKSYPWVEKS